ncbi:MAG: hypothetical protein EXS10_08805 [Phycisphaerales bacterium]|nr:hypothetical protein [Phycisphaerales bacterium]
MDSRQCASKRFLLVASMLCVGVLTLSGCKATVLKPSANDALRLENQSLKSKVEAAERAAASFEQQLLALQASDATREPSTEIREATPHVARITLVSGSMIRREEGKDTAVLLFAAQDALGREMQVAGSLAITVTAAQAGADAVTLATTTIAPLALRDCYRAGFMGTHYTVELPVVGATEEMRTALITAIFIDGWTNKEFHTDAVLMVVKKPATDQAQVDPTVGGITTKGS